VGVIAESRRHRRQSIHMPIRWQADCTFGFYSKFYLEFTIVHRRLAANLELS
jgi:hypothetical protein